MTRAFGYALRFLRMFMIACLVWGCIAVGRQFGAEAGWAAGVMLVMGWVVGYSDAKDIDS